MAADKNTTQQGYQTQSVSVYDTSVQTLIQSWTTDHHPKPNRNTQVLQVKCAYESIIYYRYYNTIFRGNNQCFGQVRHHFLKKAPCTKKMCGQALKICRYTFSVGYKAHRPPCLQESTHQLGTSVDHPSSASFIFTCAGIGMYQSFLAALRSSSFSTLFPRLFCGTSVFSAPSFLHRIRNLSDMLHRAS